MAPLSMTIRYYFFLVHVFWDVCSKTQAQTPTTQYFSKFLRNIRRFLSKYTVFVNAILFKNSRIYSKLMKKSTKTWLTVCIPMFRRSYSSVSICQSPVTDTWHYGKNYQYPGNAWDPIYNNFDHRDRFLQITPNWVCIEYASVCAFAYVHWMHNRLWSWRCWKAGDKCRNRFIQVTNTSCWRDTLALCIREKTQTSLKIHSYHMAFTFLLSYRGTYIIYE